MECFIKYIEDYIDNYDGAEEEPYEQWITVEFRNGKSLEIFMIIHECITLKLENSMAIIYVAGKQFLQSKYLRFYIG